MKYDSSDLNSLGLKATIPRLRILDIFQKAASEGERHLTADQVFSMLRDEGEDVGLATVYRVLSQFEVAGILRRHHFESDSATYELGEPEHHDHLVCVQCGKVEEFVDVEIERRQQEIADRYGFALEHHTLCLYGICKECREKNQQKSQRAQKPL